MTTDLPTGKPLPATRHVYGPRVIGAVLPSITRPAFRAGGAAGAQLMADWPIIVGPVLAKTTMPKRFSAGTLTLGCSGPVALELQHLAVPLMDRINTHLGQSTVLRLRFVQEAALSAPIASPPVRRGPEPAPVPVDGLPDGPLRDALAALGGAIRAEGA